MSQQYYVIENGASSGPFSKEELRMKGITGDTMVWRSGMNDWAPANEMEELSDIFAMADSAFGGYAAPDPLATPPPHNSSCQAPPQYQHPGQPYQQAVLPYNQGFNPYPPKVHTNWMPWAVTATIVGFLLGGLLGGVLGVIGIVQASAANSAFQRGDIAKGESDNKTARTLTIISFIITGLIVLCAILYFIFVGAWIGAVSADAFDYY